MFFCRAKADVRRIAIGRRQTKCSSRQNMRARRKLFCSGLQEPELAEDGDEFRPLLGEIARNAAPS